MARWVCLGARSTNLRSAATLMFGSNTQQLHLPRSFTIAQLIMLSELAVNRALDNLQLPQ
ncbi:hypothetical protein NQF78_21265 [Pseudomonas monsensis]|uniref:Uncharacterized protein n=1 Tax=Pseudomonas monsensis TaxID=2745509 RepID=A0ABT3YZC8_9PSED|nr:hypothetical protein [Pseudomonas monsensis]MCY0110843.1 hypothetical protein [Pseudomonas monsensis]